MRGWDRGFLGTLVGALELRHVPNSVLVQLLVILKVNHLMLNLTLKDKWLVHNFHCAWFVVYFCSVAHLTYWNLRSLDTELFLYLNWWFSFLDKSIFVGRLNPAHGLLVHLPFIKKTNHASIFSPFSPKIINKCPPLIESWWLNNICQFLLLLLDHFYLI